MEIRDIRNHLRALYQSCFGAEPDDILELPLSGSNRRYFRITSKNHKVIGTYNHDRVENKAFFYLANHLKKAGVNVPKLFDVNEEKGVYLQEDLGDAVFYDLVLTNQNDEKSILFYYKKVIEQMPKLQYEAAKGMDFSICYPREKFDKQSVQWDLNYFKYMFLKLTYVPFHEQLLEDEFVRLIDLLDEAPSGFFLFRDFQSRNIMFKGGEPYFIDFQGGREGAMQYDLASLLFESKTGLSDAIRKQLLDYYLDVFSQYEFFNRENFLHYYPVFVLVRLLQAFGAYGYRGIFERKALFVHSIRNGLENLKWVRKQGIIQEKFPYLCEVIDAMMNLKGAFWQPELTNRLTVSITSFSYKKGVPDDWSGNGGGFVFDCRALPNPGRHEAYRSSTGRDANVVEFLEKEQEVKDFIESTSNMIAKSVENYVSRGFKHLTVCFGCTGGQHRSVFSAENLFKYLKLNFDINIRLLHRELKVEEYYDKNNVQKVEGKKR